MTIIQKISRKNSKKYMLKIISEIAHKSFYLGLTLLPFYVGYKLNFKDDIDLKVNVGIEMLNNSDIINNYTIKKYFIDNPEIIKQVPDDFVKLRKLNELFSNNSILENKCSDKPICKVKSLNHKRIVIDEKYYSIPFEDLSYSLTYIPKINLLIDTTAKRIYSFKQNSDIVLNSFFEFDRLAITENDIFFEKNERIFKLSMNELNELKYIKQGKYLGKIEHTDLIYTFNKNNSFEILNDAIDKNKKEPAALTQIKNYRETIFNDPDEFEYIRISYLNDAIYLSRLHSISIFRPNTATENHESTYYFKDMRIKQSEFHNKDADIFLEVEKNFSRNKYITINKIVDGVLTQMNSIEVDKDHKSEFNFDAYDTNTSWMKSETFRNELYSIIKLYTLFNTN